MAYQAVLDVAESGDFRSLTTGSVVKAAKQIC
jgi:hypothetical protein